MTQLTRDELVTELKGRGWSRFGDSSLQRYLDWALQDVYRLGKFDAVKDVSATGVLVDGDAKVAFATIGTVAANIHSIGGVYISLGGGNISPLVEASRESWLNRIYINSLQPAGSKIKGKPQEYYIYGEDLHLWPAAGDAYTWYVQYTARADAFSSGASTSGLPERMDSAVLAAAEAQCFKRAKDMGGFGMARATLNELIDLEIANERRQFTEEAPRIERYNH